MHIEVDEAISKEGGDIVQRGVEGERHLDGSRDRSIGRIEGPGDCRSIDTHCTGVKVGHSHAIDVSGIEIARCICGVDQRDGDKPCCPGGDRWDSLGSTE